MQPTMTASRSTDVELDVELREPLAPLTFALDLNAHRTLRQMARARGTTRSALLREIVLAALASEDDAPAAQPTITPTIAPTIAPEHATPPARPRRARRSAADAETASAVA